MNSNIDLSTTQFYHNLFFEHEKQLYLKEVNNFEFERTKSPKFTTGHQHYCQPIIHTNQILFYPKNSKTVYIADRFFFNAIYCSQFLSGYVFASGLCNYGCNNCCLFRWQFSSYLNISMVNCALSAPVFLPQDIKLISEISKNIFLILNRLKVPKDLREDICRLVFNSNNWKTTHKYPFGRLVKIMEQTWFHPIALGKNANLLHEFDKTLKVGIKKIRLDSSTPANYILEVLNDERKLHTYTISQEKNYLVYKVGETITKFYSLKDVYQSPIFK